MVFAGGKCTVKADKDEVFEIRRTNLNLLIEFYGSIQQLNKITGRPRTDSTFSQIRNRTFNTWKKRSRMRAETEKNRYFSDK